jgi:hypothetical protein
MIKTNLIKLKKGNYKDLNKLLVPLYKRGQIQLMLFNFVNRTRRSLMRLRDMQPLPFVQMINLGDDLPVTIEIDQSMKVRVFGSDRIFSMSMRTTAVIGVIDSTWSRVLIFSAVTFFWTKSYRFLIGPSNRS